MFEFNMRHSA